MCKEMIMEWQWLAPETEKRKKFVEKSDCKSREDDIKWKFIKIKLYEIIHYSKEKLICT